MALVTNVSRRVYIPHEEDEWIEIKRLSWRQLELAIDVQSDDILQKLKTMGGEVLSSLKQEEKKQELVPATKYDRGIVLEAGILNWSYEPGIKSATPEERRELIDSLDEVTAAWLFEEILELNEPRSEEAQKNG